MSVLSIKIGAVLDGSFNTVIKGSSSQLTHLGENIRKLDSSLKSYQIPLLIEQIRNITNSFNSSAGNTDDKITQNICK